jgi:hypothetical protein
MAVTSLPVLRSTRCGNQSDLDGPNRQSTTSKTREQSRCFANSQRPRCRQ